MKVCPKCGYGFSDEFGFCPKCGYDVKNTLIDIDGDSTRLKTENQSQQSVFPIGNNLSIYNQQAENERLRRRNDILKWIIIVIIAILGGVGLFLVCTTCFKVSEDKTITQSDITLSADSNIGDNSESETPVKYDAVPAHTNTSWPTDVEFPLVTEWSYKFAEITPLEMNSNQAFRGWCEIHPEYPKQSFEGITDGNHTYSIESVVYEYNNGSGQRRYVGRYFNHDINLSLDFNAIGFRSEGKEYMAIQYGHDSDKTKSNAIYVKHGNIWYGTWGKKNRLMRMWQVK